MITNEGQVFDLLFRAEVQLGRTVQIEIASGSRPRLVDRLCNGWHDEILVADTISELLMHLENRVGKNDWPKEVRR